jgi:hypothetical protein
VWQSQAGVEGKKQIGQLFSEGSPHMFHNLVLSVLRTSQ